nr:prepilin-type cleavage/methylation domain-containing protein [Myxacorys almedinensis]
MTLLEILVVLLIIGAIAAIAAPSWISFLNNQKLITARNQVFDVLRQAQSTAKLQHIGHDTKFRQSGDRVEWVIHPVGDTELSTAELLTLPWNTLAEQVQLDPETTLYRKDNVYRVRFNDYGEVNGQLGRVTLSVTSGQVRKRCVIVSSLLGAMRTGESQPQKKDPKCD